MRSHSQLAVVRWNDRRSTVDIWVGFHKKVPVHFGQICLNIWPKCLGLWNPTEMFGSYPIYQNVCRFPQYYQNISNILVLREGKSFCIFRSHSHSLSGVHHARERHIDGGPAPLATPKRFCGTQLGHLGISTFRGLGRLEPLNIWPKLTGTFLWNSTLMYVVTKIGYCVYFDNPHFDFT